MIRGAGAEGQNRTDDTRLFRAVLYRLSYLGADVAESRLSLPALSHPAVARIPMACRGRNRTRPCDVSVNSRPPAAPHSVRNEPAIGGSARPRPPTSDSVGTELQEERAEPDGRSLVHSPERARGGTTSQARSGRCVDSNKPIWPAMFSRARMRSPIGGWVSHSDFARSSNDLIGLTM